ncbi:MAG: SAM-dependent DNA methyltransferase [Gammaproteobacteria bacterium]|nr:SAM-dependent DNA methyltransferase [Gammaproteobacteria bacterium]
MSISKNRVQSGTKIHEQTANVYLAESMIYSNETWRKFRDFVKVERSGHFGKSRKRPDILIDDKTMPPVIVECSFGEDGDRDAIRRLKDRDLDVSTVLSLAFPKDYEYLPDEEFKLRLRVEDSLAYAVLQIDEDVVKRLPAQGYLVGSTSDLVNLIRRTAATREKIEYTAYQVADYINRAAATLKQALSQQDCDYVTGQVFQHTTFNAFRVISILWLDAMMVQGHLRNQFRDLPRVQAKPVKFKIIDAWKKIADINWRSIFEPAVEVLERSGEVSGQSTVEAFKLLQRAVDEIYSAQLGEQINIGAEIFPKISEDRKTAAAFYTTPPTAEFLACLLIREDDRNDWSDPQLFKHVSIADLACGTGTLVRAAYRRVSALHEKHARQNSDLKSLHKAFMECGLTAADISPIASHLTNSSMAMLGPNEPYGDTNIGWVSVGEPQSNKVGLSTGSLEFLDQESLDDLFANLGSTRSGAGAIQQSIVVKKDSFDYVIMNPPYSRTRGGQSTFDVVGLSKKERNLCQARWEQLIRREPAIKTAGMAASFLCLARRIARPGGRIGFVLPLSAAFSESWTQTREMIVNEFEDIVVIARAGQNDREAFSADTHMSEMLLLATKRSPSSTTNTPADLYCVNLAAAPVLQGQAFELGRVVQATLNQFRQDGTPFLLGDEEAGYISKFQPESGEPWSNVGALHIDLAQTVRALTKSSQLLDVQRKTHHQLSIEMTTIEDLFQVGPTHHLIGHLIGCQPQGALEIYPIARRSEVEGSNRLLWHSNSRLQQTLTIEATHKGIVHDNDAFERMRDKVSTLHYQRGMRWTSQSLLCATTRHSVYGGRAWTSLITTEDNVKFAFALWGNSILGLISHWSQGQRTQGGRSTTQIKAIKKVPCPNLAKLNKGSLQRAAEEYRSLAAQPLLPACLACVDPVRVQIDEAVARVLDIPEEYRPVFKRLRKWWCAEPSVHGYKREVLSRLSEANLF